MLSRLTSLGALKMTDVKMQDMKMTDQFAGHEIAGHKTIDLSTFSICMICSENDFSCCDRLNSIVSILSSYIVVIASQAFPVILL